MERFYFVIQFSMALEAPVISRPNPEIMLQPNSETSRTAKITVRSSLLIISSRSPLLTRPSPIGIIVAFLLNCTMLFRYNTLIASADN